MSYETEEEKKKRESVRKIEVTHKHIHENVKKLPPEDKKALREMGELSEDDELLESAKIVATVGFASEKRSLVKEFPKYANQIRECKTPIELAEIMEEIEENESPKSGPSGSIQLKPSQVASSIGDGKQYKNARDLMNSLIHSMAFGSEKQKAEAKRKYEKLLQSMVENPSFGKLATTRKISNMPVLVECPRCGALMEEGTRNCPSCQHAMGRTKKFTSVSYAPSKLVREGK